MLDVTYIYAYTTIMSTPQRILRSGRDVSTPVDSVPLSLPRRSPRVHQSPVKETAAVLFADDDKKDEADVVSAAARKEKGDANKKKSSKQARAAPTKKGNKKSAEESSK
jgi:hypothetical protein